jgi:medium-chain acyl-[acyl-carrier-protein] hydrolase
MTQHSNRWLVRQPGTSRPIRLYCFCYAGGSASSYANWQADLDPSIEICAIELPGRGMRFGEAPLTSLALVTETIAALISRESTPFAFFGHSLGALIAFEVARYMQQRGMTMPMHLFASGASAPQHRRPSELHLLDDDALIDKLREFEGTPPAVLENRELMELLLPMLRADFTMAETYSYRPGPRLSMPLTVLMGREDESSENGGAEGWRKESSGPVHIEWFDGGHFFIHPKRDEVLACVCDALRIPVAV